MPISFSYQSPYLFEMDIEVDGKRADYLISQMKIGRTYNKATTVTLEIGNRPSIDQFKIGAISRLVGARAVGDSIGSTGDTVVKNLRFDGFVRLIRPKENGAVVTLTDALSLLSTGEVQDFKANDYIGEDLYYVAKNVIDTLNSTTTSSGDTLGYSNTYGGKWLDTSQLYGGSGIIASPDMDIWGFRKPKEFLDKVFGEMYKEIDGSAQKDNEYDANIFFLPWRYNIFSSNIVSFYYNDVFHKVPKATYTINEENGGLLAGGIVAQIDVSRMVNNCTCISKSDSSISANFTDTHSIRRYGDMSKSVTVDTAEYDTLQQTAYRVVQRNKEPTYSYAIKPTAQDLFIPGDIVKLTAPTAGFDTPLAVEQVDTVIGNGQIDTTLVLGERQLPIEELVGVLSQ